MCHFNPNILGNIDMKGIHLLTDLFLVAISESPSFKIMLLSFLVVDFCNKKGLMVGQKSFNFGPRHTFPEKKNRN